MEDNNKKIDEETTNEEKANNENLDKDCDRKNEANDKSDNDSKDEQKKDELTLANEKIKEWEDKYKRLLAEFDNFRKRSEKESAMMIDIGASMILTKILPIVDNFERA